MEALQTRELTLAYGDKVIINQLSLAIPKGKITVLIGSNGSGKSTLLRSLVRLLKPRTGEVLLEGRTLTTWNSKEIAKQMAILPQSSQAPEGLTVLQLVKQGRYPYQSWLRQWSTEDERIVDQALEATQLTELAGTPLDALSGGQRQRAWIAMTLAQDTDIIMLDEPTTFLDVTHQIELLDILYDLNDKEQRTIVMVLHDINLACRYAHHIIAVHKQTVYAQGSAEEIMTEKLVEDVFSMKCHMTKDPIYGTPMVIPYGKGRSV